MHTASKKVLLILLTFVFLLSFTGCDQAVTRDRDSDFFGTGDDFFEPNEDDIDDEDVEDDGEEGDAVAVSSVAEDSNLPLWTVMLYLNGTDLESRGAEATTNLNSLLSVNFPEDVNVVIYTGGTAEWQNSTISADQNQIWHIDDSGIVLDTSMELRNIGDSSTLSEFITYAQTNYPSQKKAIFFWDHGGGSVLGFGKDELFGGDGLTLDEMGQAFADSTGSRKFDLVGFDACLMATVETASMLAPYADYMVASEEVEPGGGWNYEYTYGQLAQNPGMTGKELGIAITDGYYNKYAGSEEEPIITCSVVDLSKLPALEQTLGTFFASLTSSIVAPEAMVAVSTARQKAESYGDDPTSVPYDIVDLYDFVDLQENVDAALTQQLLTQIEDAVVYEVSGSQRLYSYGLSIYFPFYAQEYFGYSLEIYNKLGFCPEYTTFVNNFAAQLVDQTYLDDVPEYEVTEITSVPVDDYSEVGSFYVELTSDEVEYLEEVYCVLGWYLDDGTLVDLGYDSDLGIEWNGDNVQIHDNFNYNWTLLNGQPVTVFVMDEVIDEYIIYNIPVLYNGELAVIKGAWIWDESLEANGEYIYNGIYYASNEYEPPNTKLMIELEYGDEITPVYPLLSAHADDWGDGYRYGEPFYVGSDGLYLEWGELPLDSDYEYGFVFVDVYGGVHYTDFVVF